MYCISTSKVAKVWVDVTEKCVNGDMNRIWHKHVHNLKGFSAVIAAVNEKILGMDGWTDGCMRLSELEQNNVHIYC
jgi:hypothetical protein